VTHGAAEPARVETEPHMTPRPVPAARAAGAFPAHAAAAAATVGSRLARARHTQLTRGASVRANGRIGPDLGDVYRRVSRRVGAGVARVGVVSRSARG
jgi:hypothetical protein